MNKNLCFCTRQGGEGGESFQVKETASAKLRKLTRGIKSKACYIRVTGEWVGVRDGMFFVFVFVFQSTVLMIICQTRAVL